ncbi:GPP34 family phosphoprotein [Phormidium tenue FACHB-886]|nr:GPP34 family phosphoprotein [Phormidium tenue FACHB-886]
MQYLVQDLMLLALENEKGHVVSSAASALPYALTGALLMELVLQGKLDSQRGKLVVVDSSSTGNDFFDACLNEMLTIQRPKDAQFWVGRLANRFQDIKTAVLNNLVELGVLTQQEHRVLGIFPVQRYPLLDIRAKQSVVDRVCMAVLNDAEPDARTAALISLIQACNLTHHLFLPEERREARQRIKAIAEGERMGKAVSDTVASVQAAINAGVTAAIIASTASTSSSSNN